MRHDVEGLATVLEALAREVTSKSEETDFFLLHVLPPLCMPGTTSDIPKPITCCWLYTRIEAHPLMNRPCSWTSFRHHYHPQSPLSPVQRDHLCLGWVWVGDLNDGWASSDGVVVDGVLAASEDQVGLVVGSLRDLDLEAAINWGGITVDWACDADEGSVDGGLAVLESKGVAWVKMAISSPDLIVPVVPSLRAGKALTGRAPLDAGQETMN
jgi:hypothetical protein